VPRTHLVLALSVATSAAVAALACGTGTPASPSAPAMTPPSAAAPAAFPIDPPAVYVAKVKNILVGLPPSADEVATVQADPTQLGPLIDGWMKLPEYQTKMMRFFELAFQQTQVTITDYSDQSLVQTAYNGYTSPALVQNLSESFARTMLELDSEGKPFTTAMTTQTFMMTPAMMELYAFYDAWQVDDAGKYSDRLASQNITLTLEKSAGPIPIEQSLDPSSPNYMHWYNPDLGNAYEANQGCADDPIVIPPGSPYSPLSISLNFLLYGTIPNRINSSGKLCVLFPGTLGAVQFSSTDFTAWKMVTIRQPSAGETPTLFYDLPTLRSATELVLTAPRIGFFSTPAFFANWPTNTSNQMRVTTNQALIVATGASVDGTDSTVPSSTPGLDAAHASGSACFSCHQLLDPTRSILAMTYSDYYHDQTDPSFLSQKGLFAFRGVVQAVNTIADFGNVLATHPLFAQAWVQKLCYYANSVACETNDPEFQRVAGLFQSSGYSWDTLVKAILSSPLTTHAAPTQTVTDTLDVIAVSRRDHLCAALDARLGFVDVCGLNVFTKAQAQSTIAEIVSGLPSDGYGRGSVAPVLPNQPTLFYRAGTENICEAVAGLVIDAGQATPGVKQWSSAQPDAAMSDFVQIVMGLVPSDPRAAPAQTILEQHFAAATQSGASASDALKSTFTLACLAPSSVSIGL
jgi:hypothetical protein